MNVQLSTIFDTALNNAKMSLEDIFLKPWKICCYCLLVASNIRIWILKYIRPSIVAHA